MHALLGENGAGKSTLMNILYGLYHPDEGEILIKGSPVRLGSPSAAIDAGVGMVHQHFMLIPVMTVAENIVLAEEPTREGVLLDMRGGGAARAGDLRPLRPRGRPGCAHPGHHRRPAAARRDPQGALSRRRHPRPRRAHRGAHAAGGTGALRGRATADGARQVDHLHLAQAQRGARDRRPDHRAPPRQADRDAARARRDGGEPRAPDGRSRGPAPRREDAGAAVGAAAPDRGPQRLRRPRDREGARRHVRRAGGRDRRPRRDRRERPDGADRRDHGPLRRLRRDGERRRRGRDARVAARPPRGRDRPHPGGPSAPRARARVLDRREHRPPRLPLAARVALRLALPAPADRACAEADPRLRRARRRPDDPRPAACPAATSRRSCSPARSSATRRC